MISVLFGFVAVIFWLLSLLYVYFDSEARSKSRAFAALLTATVAMTSWPMVLLAYIACTVILDRRPFAMTAT